MVLIPVGALVSALHVLQLVGPASDYGGIGFQASFLIFPTPGCWEITAQVGDREKSRLTFITRVEKIGDGPTWRRGPR